MKNSTPKKYTDTEKQTFLSQIEDMRNRGVAVGTAIKRAGISPISYYLWRKETPTKKPLHLIAPTFTPTTTTEKTCDVIVLRNVPLSKLTDVLATTTTW